MGADGNYTPIELVDIAGAFRCRARCDFNNIVYSVCFVARVNSFGAVAREKIDVKC